MITQFPALPADASAGAFAATLEESLNQLLQLRDQMNREIDSHVERLREIRQELTPATVECNCPALFEAEPSFEEVDEEPEFVNSKKMTRMPAIDEPAIDPLLEQATLDELNAALAMAFAQVSQESDEEL